MFIRRVGSSVLEGEKSTEEEKKDETHAEDRREDQTETDTGKTRIQGNELRWSSHCGGGWM